MEALIFKESGIKYPITPYGKLDYLERLFTRNYNDLIDYVDKGNWVVPNQNVLALFIDNIAPDLTWDDEYLFNHIKNKHKSVASLLEICSLYNKGSSHTGTVFQSKEHAVLFVIPFGEPERDFKYYFSRDHRTLSPLKTIFTTDSIQRWDIRSLTTDSNSGKKESNYSIVQLDPYALVIGYVRYCRERIVQDRLVGLTPESYICSFPLVNFYRQHNLMTCFNNALEGNAGYDFLTDKVALLDYSNVMNDYTSFIHNKMVSANPDNVEHFIRLNGSFNPGQLTLRGLFPYKGLSLNFDGLTLPYCFNGMLIALHYLKHCELMGKDDGTFLATLKRFMRGDMGTMSRQIKDPLFKALFIRMFLDLKDRLKNKEG